MRTSHWLPIAALTLAACGTDTGETLRLGGLFATTGPLAPKGFAQLSAARLAVQQINDQGGVLGQRVVLVYRDDGDDENKGRRATEALLATGVPAIIGPVNSEMALLASGIVQDKAVVLSPSATSNQLAASGALRLCQTDDAEGRLLAQIAKDQGYRRAAILRRAGEPLDGVPDAFAAAFAKGDRTVVADLALAPGQESYRDALAQAFAADPDVVVLHGDPVDGAQVVRDYVTGLSSHRAAFLFSHELEDPAFVTAAGAQSFNFPHRGVGPSTPTGRRFQYFSDAYSARFGTPPPVGSYAANAYDAVLLICAAIEAAGSTDPGAVRAQLGPVSLGGRAFGPDEWTDLVKAIHAGEDVNYEGASGSVDLGPNGATDAPYDVWQVKDGAIQVVERAVRPPL